MGANMEGEMRRTVVFSLAAAVTAAAPAAEVFPQATLQEAQEVLEIAADSATVELVASWDEDIWIFTLGDNPVRSLDGLTRKDVACWGIEHFERMTQFFETAGIEGDPAMGAQVRVVGLGASPEEPVRLFVSWARFADDMRQAGFIRAKLVRAS